MDSLEPKKLALIRILQIFQKYSDYDHPLKQDDIAKYLDSEYGIVIERKAIGRNISLLKEAGFGIESRHDGSYIAERDFTDAELRLLIDGVLSSKYISAKYSSDLIKKISGLSNKYFAKHIKHIYSVNSWEKTENVSVFYSIEIIDEAVETNRQVKFTYNKYGKDKKLHRSAVHTVSPYQMILHNQRYYLMGYNEKWKDIRYYRLDRITDIDITDSAITPLREIKGYENGIDYKRYSSMMPYMFADEPQPIEVLAEEWALDQIIDWFGKDISIEKSGEKYLIKVKASINAMEYWAMQYLNAVEILKPAELRDRIRNNLQQANEKYKGE